MMILKVNIKPLLFVFLLQIIAVACNNKKHHDKEKPTKVDFRMDDDEAADRDSHENPSNTIRYKNLGQMAMKFAIPKTSIAAKKKPIQADIRKEIEDKIGNAYPNIDSLTLIHYATIPKFADYYEYSAMNTTGEKVYIFGIKHKDSSLVLNAFSSETKLSTESRYELDKNTLWVYKQSNYRNETIAIAYTLEINRIYFGRDDGFSSWE